jgi:hypothetical protein
MIILLVKPGMLVGWLALAVGDMVPEDDPECCGDVGTPFDGPDKCEVTGTEEMMGVISGVMVDSVLNRLGGVMLFIHSVVPLMTEK